MVKKALVAICAISLLQLSACDNGPKVSPEATTEIIAEKEIDYDGNGVAEKLYVRMAAGELKEETEPGPYMGSNWEGEFRLELVAEDGSLLHELDLNSTFGGETLIFAQNREFDISFEDYNNDGYPDFSIGQYFSSNGFTYHLYSLMPTGITVIHRDLFTADSTYSTLYEKAGNTSFKNRYYDMEKGALAETLFTWQGDRFVRTECEGCELEVGGAENNGIAGELQFSVEKTTEGFRLAHGDGNEFYMAQTLISPPIEDLSYAVHIVRTSSGYPEIHFRRDAVVVNPATAEFRSFPLYDAVVDDMYGPDSLAVAYGFMDDRNLVYVSVVNDTDQTDGYTYQIQTLNILTGEQSVLFAEIPGVQITDHFAPGWMNEAKDTLVLNSYGSGQLWSFDLRSGEIIRPQINFSHSWPFYLTAVAPDGERFWYTDYTEKEFRLHDKAGQLLSKAAFGQGYAPYPAFQWSPNSRYAVIQDTRDQSEEHIIGDNGETYIIAPQRIRWFDWQGKLVRTVQTDQGIGKYIEVAGWLDDGKGSVLLHEYELQHGTEPQAAKVNSSYRLLDLKSGDMLELKIVPDSTQSADSDPSSAIEYIHGAEQRIYKVDTKQNLLAIVAENGIWLTAPNENRDAWVTNLYGEGAAIYYEFSPDTGKIREKALGTEVPDVVLIGDKWLVWGDMNYTQLD